VDFPVARRGLRPSSVPRGTTISSKTGFFAILSTVWGFSVWAHNYPTVDSQQKERTYQTYTKTNPETGQVYSGRASGFGTPLENLARREAAGHDWTAKGYGPAVLDQTSSSYSAIRGREQMLKDHYQGLGIAAPQDNPISPRNPNRQNYLNAAVEAFGNL
jgi:hypothetical protein